MEILFRVKVHARTQVGNATGLVTEPQRKRTEMNGLMVLQKTRLSLSISDKKGMCGSSIYVSIYP